MTTLEEQLAATSRAKLLDLLTKNKGRLSSKDLASEEISRAVRLLEADGYVFEKSEDALVQRAQADLLRPEYITPYLSKARRIRWYEVIDSTNEEAKRASAAGDAGNLVLIAERQTAGKGRLGRSWQTDPGQEVQMSFLLKPHIGPSAISGASFAAGLGIATGLRKCGVPARIKWPNDVVVGTKKICGILIETSMDFSSLGYVIVGTGINVNQTSFSDELSDKATSLAMETGTSHSRVQVAACLIDSVYEYMDLFFDGGISRIMDQYCALSSVLDQDITVYTEDGPQNGHCVGFSDIGEIRVDCGGTVQCFSANDVSVRGTVTYT